MIHIEEVSIKQEKSPIFIDYAAIGGSPKKRLRFLRALLKIVDLKEDIIHYEQLGLEQEEIEQFKQFLNERYRDNFRINKKTFNADEFDGKIICNIDKLINDIFEIFSQELGDNQRQIDLPIQENVTTKTIDAVTSEKKPFIIEAALEKEPHRYLNEIFHEGLCEAETTLFVKRILKESNPDEMEKIFVIFDICNEINKIPFSIKNQKATYEDAKQLKNILIKILKKIEEYAPKKDYWNKLIPQIEKQFDKILLKCDDQHRIDIFSENGTAESLTINEILLNENLKIFIAEQGRTDVNDRNSVISKFSGKVAMFNFKFSLSKKIQPNDYVIAEVEAVAENYIIINPLRILTREEVQKLTAAGMEVFPSISNIQSQEP